MRTASPARSRARGYSKTYQLTVLYAAAYRDVVVGAAAMVRGGESLPMKAATRSTLSLHLYKALAAG